MRRYGCSCLESRPASGCSVFHQIPVFSRPHSTLHADAGFRIVIHRVSRQVPATSYYVSSLCNTLRHYRSTLTLCRTVRSKANRVLEHVEVLQYMPGWTTITRLLSMSQTHVQMRASCSLLLRKAALANAILTVTLTSFHGITLPELFFCWPFNSFLSPSWLAKTSVFEGSPTIWLISRINQRQVA